MGVYASACSGMDTNMRPSANADAEYICNQLCEAIEEVGAEHVVAVITDSAPNCKGAGALVEQRFPSITWMPCAAHCLDLVLEDIGKTDWAQVAISKARQVGYGSGGACTSEHASCRHFCADAHKLATGR